MRSILGALGSLGHVFVSSWGRLAIILGPLRLPRRWRDGCTFSSGAPRAAPYYFCHKKINPHLQLINSTPLGRPCARGSNRVVLLNCFQMAKYPRTLGRTLLTGGGSDLQRPRQRRRGPINADGHGNSYDLDCCGSTTAAITTLAMVTIAAAMATIAEPMSVLDRPPRRPRTLLTGGVY